MGMDENQVKRRDGGNEYGLTDGQYYTNLILMCLLFTCFSFSFWLVDFQIEYLGTDIYVLFYANGVVCILSGQINLLVYGYLGIKRLIIIV